MGALVYVRGLPEPFVVEHEVGDVVDAIDAPLGDTGKPSADFIQLVVRVPMVRSPVDDGFKTIHVDRFAIVAVGEASAS